VDILFPNSREGKCPQFWGGPWEGDFRGDQTKTHTSDCSGRKGREGKGRAGKGREGKGRGKEKKGHKGKGGKGRDGKGREGKENAKEGKERKGKGREGKGRAFWIPHWASTGQSA
jgi:hypothetical protein